MCDDDSYANANLQRRFVTARKQHECYSCDEAIGVGHRYHLDINAAEGRITVTKHCLRCWAMVEALWKRGVPWVSYDLNCGELWEGPPPEVAALAFALPGETPGFDQGGE